MTNPSFNMPRQEDPLPTIKPEPKEAKTPAPKLSGPPADILERCIVRKGPPHMIDWRAAEVIRLSGEAYDQVEREILQELLLSPDTPQFWFDLATWPGDVVGLLIARMQRDGWECAFQPSNCKLLVTMPLVPVLAPDYQPQRQVSVAKPL